MKIKTTKVHYKIFKDMCKHLQKRFNLLDWSLDFEHKKLESAVAESFWSLEHRSCILRLSTMIDQDSSDVENYIKKCARHEMTHLLLAKLDGLAKSRSVKIEDICAEIEGICMLFETFDI